jgi:hypothetical protein
VVNRVARRILPLQSPFSYGCILKPKSDFIVANKKENCMRPVRVPARAVLLAITLLVCGLTIGADERLKVGTVPAQQVKVPSVVGMLEPQARAVLAEAGLKMKVGPVLPNPDPDKKGKVASQTPAAGTNVKKGSTVTIRLYVTGATTEHKGA